MLPGGDITTATELFLQDVSVEDYVEDMEDHGDCSCEQCTVFEELLLLERSYHNFLQGREVPDDLKEICAQKYARYHSS